MSSARPISPRPMRPSPSARPRHRLVHQGHVALSGLYYGSHEEDWARRDILHHLVPGARVYRHRGHLLVVLPEPKRVSLARVRDRKGAKAAKIAGYLA